MEEPDREARQWPAIVTGMILTLLYCILLIMLKSENADAMMTH